MTLPHTPEAYWTSYEERDPIEDLSDLLSHIEYVGTQSDFTVWRGVSDHRWGLHSSLRRYIVRRGLPPPNETELANEEARILRQAREWGLNRAPSALSGLELIAKLQHSGSPTRLIDATHDPLVAAWFATSMAPEPDPRPADYTEPDGRLFAMDHTNRQLADDGQPEPIWRRDRWAGELENATWVWTPPPIDSRMAAQSGAFLVGQAPTATATQWYNSGDPRSRYIESEMRELTSIPIRAYKKIAPGATLRQNPLVSVRIGGGAKAHLRASIEKTFNLSPQRLFPDVFGLADHIRGRLAAPRDIAASDNA